MTHSTQTIYPTRIQRVVEYIEAHLDEDLSLDRLSAVAGLSRFHFHRQFSALTGTTVARLTRRLRLKRAAWYLVFSPDMRVLDIALAAGFSNPETFARAFKNERGQTPTGFRQNPSWQAWDQILVGAMRHMEIDVTPEIVTFEETPVAVLEHRGPPHRIMDTVTRFIAWRKASAASPEAISRTFGLAYDDPETTEPENYRFDVCGELQKPLEDNPTGVVQKTIPGGRCALVRHVGSHDTIGLVVRELYARWLPESGETLRDFPCFFHYEQRMPRAPEHQQITNIYLPLA